MRLLILALATALPAHSAAAPAPDSNPGAREAAARGECQRPDRHLADRQLGLQPRKLGELPPATAYMAVYRTVDGCEVPLTVADYRRNRL